MYIYNLRFKVKPLFDLVVPPFTSKVSRLILYKLLGFKADLVKKGVSFKPVIISPLFDGTIPLYKSARDSQMLIIKNNQEYWFRVVLIGEKFGEILGDLIDGGVVKVFNIDVNVKTEGEALSFEEIGFHNGEDFKINFLTPTLLQLPKAWKEEERHVLFPFPSLIIRSLVEHWNKYCPDNLRINGLTSLIYYSNHYLIEVDYNLKAVTVIYDDVRRPRGFIGWVIYKLKKRRENDKRFKTILKLLDYANYVGVGKSRSIGFGQVEVAIPNDSYKRKLIKVKENCQRL